MNISRILLTTQRICSFLSVLLICLYLYKLLCNIDILILNSLSTTVWLQSFELYQFCSITQHSSWDFPFLETVLPVLISVSLFLLLYIRDSDHNMINRLWMVGISFSPEDCPMASSVHVEIILHLKIQFFRKF